MDWKIKLNKFLDEFEHKNHIIGILVCGSYVTGNYNKHSDLDLHIILKEAVRYRERGNKVVDGLLIEYFANSPKQVRKYFEEDYSNYDLMSQTQFSTGLILRDDKGEVQKLKEEAEAYMDRYFSDTENNQLDAMEKYSLWDRQDDLESLFDMNSLEFDFVFYCNLNFLLSKYMKINKMPYGTKTILGQISQKQTREKYLLKEFSDRKIAVYIYKCITSEKRSEKLLNYKKITQKVFELSGGFEIDGFKFKSAKDV